MGSCVCFPVVSKREVKGLVAMSEFLHDELVVVTISTGLCHEFDVILLNGVQFCVWKFFMFSMGVEVDVNGPRTDLTLSQASHEGFLVELG